MAISRMHPVCNWVRLAPHEHRRALDKVLQFRDAAPDPMASGLPEAAVVWFWTEELPRLLSRPDVRNQALERRAVAFGITKLLVGAALANHLKPQLPEDVCYLR